MFEAREGPALYSTATVCRRYGCREILCDCAAAPDCRAQMPNGNDVICHSRDAVTIQLSLVVTVAKYA